MLFKGVNPEGDFRRVGAIERDIYQMLGEHDYDPIPALHYQEEGTNLV